MKDKYYKDIGTFMGVRFISSKWVPENKFISVKNDEVYISMSDYNDLVNAKSSRVIREILKRLDYKIFDTTPSKEREEVKEEK